MTARWASIPGWPEYEVSDDARCQSLERVVDGKIDGSGMPSKRRLAGQLLTPVTRPSGLICFNLWSDNQYEQVPVGRLMLAAFVGPRPRGMDVGYKDGDRSNNRLDNLEWRLPESAGAIRRTMGIR